MGATFKAAIETELAGLRGRDLSGPAWALSERYRSGEMTEESRGFAAGQLQAYLATRVPATFAVTRRVLSELASLKPDWAPTSLLDLGAGPGTATWAAMAVFPSIEHAELVEREGDMAVLGARLATMGSPGVLAGAVWTVGDACEVTGPKSDLVVAAYVLGELGHDRESRRSSDGGGTLAASLYWSNQGLQRASNGCELQGAPSSHGERT